MMKKQTPNMHIAWCHVLALIVLSMPHAYACDKQVKSNKSKCIESKKTLPYVLLANIERDKIFVKQTHSNSKAHRLHVAEDLSSYVDVIFFDLNGDYLTDALVRQKPKDAKDNATYPLYIYKNIGTDDRPAFEKIATIDNASLPVIVLEKHRKGWRDIVINTNKYSDNFAGALFYHNGKTYVQSPNAFLGTVLK